MKYYFRIIYPLVVIAIGIGLVMGLTYQLLEPKLARAEKAEEETALKAVIPDAARFEARSLEGHPYYVAYDGTNGLSGYVFRTSYPGYGGPVTALVGITNGAVRAVLIVSMEKETPGLGTKAKDPNWLAQFAGLTWKRIPLSKSGFRDNGLDAVSGATITSMAVAHDIQKAFLDYTAVTGKAEPGVDLDAMSQASYSAMTGRAAETPVKPAGGGKEKTK